MHGISIWRVGGMCVRGVMCIWTSLQITCMCGGQKPVSNIFYIVLHMYAASTGNVLFPGILLFLLGTGRFSSLISL